MKRRAVNKRSQQQPKVEVQQLSPKDIKAREEEYQKDRKDFESGLIAGERFKKNGIIKLAKDLEKAGTVEVHKISARLKADLKHITDRGFLHPVYINDVLADQDPKYIRPYKKQSKPTQKEELRKSLNSEQQEQQAEEPTTTTTTRYTTPLSTTSTTTPQPKAKTPEEIEFDKYVSELYDFIRSLTQLLTGLEVDKFLTYRDNIKLLADTKNRRFDVAMRLSPLDLDTIYDDCKRVKVILDDFIDRLGDQRNSRRQKREMISE